MKDIVLNEYEKYQLDMERLAKGELVACSTCQKGFYYYPAGMLKIKCSYCNHEIKINVPIDSKEINTSRKYVTVPKNQNGIVDYDYGRDNSPNVIFMELKKNEFDFLFDKKVAEQINEKYHLLIDDYKSEIIPFEAMDYVLELIDEFDMPVFKLAVGLAKYYETFIGLDF